MQAHHYKLAGLLVLSVVAITVAFLLPPIAQDPAYQVFFIGILLTGFGSAWYHLAPTNESLVWDRLPMLLVPVILLMFRSRLDGVAYLWGMVAAYVVSKLAEYYDAEIYAVTGFLSGHSIKHMGGRCSFTWPCVTGIRLSISPCEAVNMYCSKRSRE